MERFKDVTRVAWTLSGRQESTAEHSFRLALFFYVLKDYFPEIDWFKALSMALIHDLSEACAGDVSAVLEQRSDLKFEKAKEGLGQSLPLDAPGQILNLFMEYNEAVRPKAELIKALDKLETVIQHNQGQNPANLTTLLILVCAKEYT